MNLIQIDILIPIPKKLVVTIPGDNPGEPPKEMKFVPNAPEFHVRRIEGLLVALGPGEDQNHPHIPADQYSYLQLSLYVEESDFMQGLEKARPVIESVFDNLSFQMQQPLQPLNLDLLDVSVPLTLGEQRDIWNVANPATILFPKHFIAPPSEIPINLVPSLEKVHPIENKPDQIALWWYIKSLHTPFLLDKLSFYTIIIDIITKPHKVGPYRTSCGHEIAVCPTPGCGTSIEKPLIGESVKEYLLAKGFSKQEANKLWDIRQVVHGKDLFNYVDLDKASLLVNKLRVLIFNDLKKRVNMHEIFPDIDINTVFIPPHNPILYGHRAIVESDMEIEKAFEDFKKTENP